ncbi:MAG: hypothetical protein EU530_03815 [Promethearchaeota archaeon]|nr:MAG: hypothetical protein EU530_03815 [Candidatus Lokiarchaeota archaeon]
MTDNNSVTSVDCSCHEQDTLYCRSQEKTHSNSHEKDTQTSRVRKTKVNINLTELSQPKIEYFGDNKNPKYSFPLDDRKTVYLTKDGIVDSTGKYYWTWEPDSFIIERIFNYTNGEIRLDFSINGDTYYKIPFGTNSKKGRDLADIVYKKAGISGKNYINILLPQLLKDVSIPNVPVVSICGFRKNGWQLPPFVEIESKSGIKQQAIKCIHKAMQQKINRKTARKYAKELYSAISTQHKDILLAWAMIAPFFDALLDDTNLRPCLILQGDNSTRKTQIATVLTKKIWGNFENVIAPNNLQSDSRTDDYICTSTFGVAFDDVENLRVIILGKLKSYTTSRTKNQKKNLEHGLDLDDEMVAWIVLTCNELPQILNDSHFLSRVLLVPINTQPTEEQKTRYNSVMTKIPDGCLGRFIFQMTKDWNAETVLEIYNRKEPKNEFSLRQNTIYRLILTGADIFEHVFEFPLHTDTDELNSLLQSALTIDDKDILTAIILQIQGSERENHPRVQVHTLRNGTKGIVFTKLALNVLNQITGKQLSLGKLSKILQRNWSKVPKTEVFTVKRKQYKGIFIPDEYWKESD